METINIHVKPSEVNTTLTELMVACRLEQIRSRALLESLVENMLTEEQKQGLESLSDQSKNADANAVQEVHPVLTIVTEDKEEQSSNEQSQDH